MTQKDDHTIKLLNEISNKLSALISLFLRSAVGDSDFARSKKKKKGTGDLVYFLANFGLEAPDIAAILGSPLASVRTLLTPKRRGK